MLEVEAKARCASLVEARARCAALGGKLLGAEEQRDTYFAHPVRDFARTDEALRLRTGARGVELTYKGAKLPGAAKAREELTLPMHDEAATALVLERLGFRRVAAVVKRREAWSVAGAEVALDEVEGLGSFVEVELLAQDAAEAARLSHRVLALLRDLGAGEPLRASYLEMLLEARAPP